MYKKSINKNNENIKTSVRPYLFTKKINTNHKLVPFNISVNDAGSTKYLPPISKEWKNSVYYYNSNNSINYPVLGVGKSQILRDKLSNSRDTLKLMVPNLVENNIGGWSNDSCKVINQKISEKNVGYRGSKSVLIDRNFAVKEQRVYGSYCVKIRTQLRYILNGFERNYKIRIPSNQIINKLNFVCNYTSMVGKQQGTAQDLILNPWFITGFSDAEGCFTVSIVKNNKLTTGWGVRAKFQINLSEKDKTLLERVQSYFGLDRGIYLKRNEVILQVDSIKGLKVIINHFDKYPLRSQKLADYLLFKQIFYLILNKEHLTEEGIRKIVAIKATLNKGLPSGSDLEKAFPGIIPAQRPWDPQGKENTLTIDPYWLGGFAEGEGCFFVVIQNYSSSKTGFSISLRFQITQHIRDIVLMQSLVDFLGCGQIIKRPDGKSVDFKVTKFSELVEKVIPFFERMPLLGVKAKNLEDFCKVANIMKAKGHLTKQGLDQILGIKTGMNTGRVLDIED